MGFRKDEVISKGALISSSSSISKIQRARRKFLNKLSRARSKIRTVSIPRSKHSWRFGGHYEDNGAVHDGGNVAVQSQRSKLSRCTPTEPLVSVVDSSPSPSSELRNHVNAHYEDNGAVHDEDNVAVQSQGSKLSRCTSTETLGSVADSSPSPSSELRNHDLHLWNQMREQWVGDKKKSRKRRQVRDPKISPDATYESLIENNEEPFAEPIPLIEMVIFLVDEWEQEGMYDINNVMLH